MPNYDTSTHIVYLDLPVAVASKIDAIRRSVRSPGLQGWKAHITIKQDADYAIETDVISQIVPIWLEI